jgi:hypothetical protein
MDNVQKHNISTLSYVQQDEAMCHTSNQALKNIKFLWRQDYPESTLATPVYRRDSAAGQGY